MTLFMCCWRLIRSDCSGIKVLDGLKAQRRDSCLPLLAAKSTAERALIKLVVINGHCSFILI